MSGEEETPAGEERPDRAAGTRPADAARRALRAARERDRYGAEAEDPQDSAAGGAPAARTAREAPGRPGDAARDALRRAVRSRAAGLDEPAAMPEAVKPEAEEPTERPVEDGSLTPSAPGRRPAERVSADPGDPPFPGGPGPGASTGEGSRPAVRPGDIAREALRAAREATGRARAEAESTRAEATAGEDRTPRRAATGRDRASAGQVRAVRELPADAFELPSEAAHERAGTSEPGPDTMTGETAGPGPETGDPKSLWDEPGRAPDESPEAVGSPSPRPSPPTGGRVPRTMAAPSRDGELRRTFRPFPPRPSAGEAFAESWWGNAWVAALEEGALDPARLARGRAYADKGRVDAVTVTPGLVLAYVHGGRARPYRVQLRLRTLGDEEWDRFLDAAAEQPAHIAALLDKELPQTLAEPGPAPGAEPEPAPGAVPRAEPEPAPGAVPSAGRGVRLLPGPGELEPRCSCPDFGHPCKHAAALCYQTARLLDEDPFVLLLLRGRGERELLDALSRRNAARAARAAQEQEPIPQPGVRARDALAPRTLPPLPAPLPPPPHPEQPPVYPAAPGGPDPFALDQLATDAAARAHALLTTGRDPVAELTLWQDAVRLAAARPGSGLTATTRALYSSLAAATGRTPADLARAVAAWRQGGLEALTVLEEPWDPPAGRFDRARPLLLAADLPAFRPWRNHLTHPRGHVQLRLGRDGLWYAYESEPGHDDWWPRGTPDLDPVGALTGLGATDG
ncbi:SWIM zinc finger family protein [Streptomyces sp. NPDC002324]